EQIDPIHRSEGSQRCTEILAAHHYCPPAVPCKPLRRPWRARPTPCFSVVAVLVTLGLTAAACNTTSPGKAHGEPPVLGQQSGTPAAVGQPAPAGTGQLDAVSCAGVERCWAVGTPGPGTTGTVTSSPTSTSTPNSST